ncbi:DALR anticodon-binding domain-containing protein [Paenibacillus filicis]|uniref:arginine--tRNA ligase n=1 Tax=Paenibacillus filicis TaxID=669464 RepID=A0ABU9DM67_9BACL
MHNYIDDLGNQLADTLVAMKQVRTEDSYVRFGDYCWDIYAGVNQAYQETPELLEERVRVLHELEAGEAGTSWLGLLVAERIVREHLEEMGQFGIGYDVLVWESRIVREGFWSKAFELLQGTSVFRQETEGRLAGCWVLKQAGSGEEKRGEEDYQTDKVLVRSNGILTYTAKDIAYHLWKFGLLGRDFSYRLFAPGLWTTAADGFPRPELGRADLVINVIDQRQEYPQEMVRQALLALGYEGQAERLEHVSYGVVSLSPGTAEGLGVNTSEGKRSYPMSGRQGIGVRIGDFLQRMEGVVEGRRSRASGLSSREIAAASIRYYLLRFHMQTEVIFDLDQAAEISGNTGVYLLYAYARACSILSKAGPGAASASSAIPAGAEPQEYALLRHLLYWPEVLEKAARELAPHLLCTYAYELSGLFNHFYAACPILQEQEPLRSFRLQLTEGYRTTMRDALDVLGLPAPEEL